MPAQTLNLTIEQGATFTKTLVWKDSNGDPIDLSGYTARMQIRRTITSCDVLVDATTENGKITLTPEEGKIDIRLEAAETEALDFREAVYDLELQSADGFVTRLVQGTVELSLEVTRPQSQPQP